MGPFRLSGLHLPAAPGGDRPGSGGRLDLFEGSNQHCMQVVLDGFLGERCAFGLLSVAEGVETDSQRRELTRLGCDYAQGYLWSPPVAAEQLTDMLTGASASTPATRLLRLGA